MVSKFGLLAVAAAFIAYSPLAMACSSGASAQLSNGAQLAQAQTESPMQPQMNDQGSSAQDQSSPAQGQGSPANDSEDK